MTSWLRIGIGVVATAGLPGCGAAEEGPAAPKGLEIAWTAEAGSDRCVPKRTVRAEVAESGLLAVRGEARYVDTRTNEATEIPFQAVFHGFGDGGISTDDAEVGLNQHPACEDLRIEIDIERCEYMSETAQDEQACPDITQSGTEGFAEVVLRRADRP